MLKIVPLKRIAAILLVLAAGCTATKDLNDGTAEDIVVMEPIEVLPEPEVYNPSEKKVNDLVHTRLEVSFDWGKQHLHGKARLDFKPYFYPTDRLILDAKGFDIHKVELATDSNSQALEYEYDNWYLDINLGRKYSRFEKYSVYIEYTAKPNELPIGGSHAILSDKGLYFINPDSSEVDKPTQIWTQGQTESSSCWFPTIDSPNERMTQEIFINVDKRYKTLSNGELVYSNFNADGTRTDYWNQTQSHPPYLVMMAVGDFVIAMDQWEKSNGEIIPVNYYMEPDYAPYAYKIFGNTPEMLSFFSELLDYEYPWSKYSQVIVRDYVSGAMENTTATIHGEFLNATDRELLDGDNEDVISHELFHHWFGDLVTCESWANLPLNESFATYGEYLWNEHKYGRDHADHWGLRSMQGYLQEARVKRVPIIRYGYYDKDDMFDAHSYNKGGRILHMLRSLLGDEAFFLSLNKYLKNNEFADAEAHTLRLACEQVTGLDLNWFFDQWFFSAGHPELDIRYEYSDSLKEQWVIVEQTQDIATSSVFKFPITVEWMSDKLYSQDYFVENAIDTLKISASAAPRWVNFDRDKVLLCEREDNKETAWWIAQFENANNYVDRYDALNRAMKEYEPIEEIIVMALNDDSWYIRESALSQGVGLLSEASLEKVESKIVELTKDERSNVRAAALSQLSTYFDGTKYVTQFEAAMDDLSYSVMSSGLIALSRWNEKEALLRAKELEDEKSGDIQEAVATVYMLIGDESHNEYFLNALDKASAGDKFYLIIIYGDYLMEQSPEHMRNHVGNIGEIAKKGDPWWIRYAAVQSLFVMHQDLEAQKIELQTGPDEAINPENVAQLNELDLSISVIKGMYNDALSTETHSQILGSFLPLP